MVEREPRYFPEGAAQGREQHEAQRLNSIKEYIAYLAFVFSRDAPDQEEDIAQAAREAMVRKLRGDPDCHISHLKVKAKSGIRDYRRRGKSVDGKLNETDRQRHYDTLNIDQVVTEVWKHPGRYLERPHHTVSDHRGTRPIQCRPGSPERPIKPGGEPGLNVETGGRPVVGNNAHFTAPERRPNRPQRTDRSHCRADINAFLRATDI